MESGYENIYIRHEPGMDRAEVLRKIAKEIVNGRIHFTGTEIRDGEVYWVKDCGEYELVIPMPYENERTLIFDVYGRQAVRIEVRSKNLR